MLGTKTIWGAQFVFGFLVASVVLLGLGATSKLSESDQNVTLKRIQIVDEEGRVRMILGRLAGSELGIPREENYGLIVRDEHGYTQVYAHGARPKTGVMGFSLDSLGFSGLILGAGPRYSGIQSRGEYGWSMEKGDGYAFATVHAPGGRRVKMGAYEDDVTLRLTSMGDERSIGVDAK
jgi:hypothetical protein